jgi:hypothetical protein
MQLSRQEVVADGGEGDTKDIENPYGVGAIEDGRIIIIDTEGAKILLFDPEDETFVTIAGTGVHGFNGDTQAEHEGDWGETVAEQTATQTKLGNLHVHILDFTFIN